MKIVGRPFGFFLVAILLWILAVAHPIVWLQAQGAAAPEQPQPHPAAQYVALLEASQPVRKTLRGQALIGYASEAEIDTRIGGPTQARYYLSQFALAPVLVDLGSAQRPDDANPSFVLANFEFPEQLRAYLSERSRRAVVSLNEYVALTRAQER
jgi:hypothetical protein